MTRNKRLTKAERQAIVVARRERRHVDSDKSAEVDKNIRRMSRQ